MIRRRHPQQQEQQQGNDELSHSVEESTGRSIATTNRLLSHTTSSFSKKLFSVTTISVFVLSGCGIVLWTKPVQYNYNHEIEIPTPLTQSLEDVTTEFAYYSRLKNDRSGSCIDHMLHSFGYAYLKRQTYMGACGSTRPSYLENHKRLLQSIGLDSILKFQCPNETAINPQEVKTHTMQLWESRESTLVQTAFENDWNDFDAWKLYLRKRVAKHLSSTHDYSSPNSNNNKFTIVVHIRRGDIHPCCYQQRYLPNLYYQAMIDEALEKHLHSHDTNNAVEVIMFSEEASYETFDEFIDKGYTLILGGDLENIWTTMIMSDVLIISQSDFSKVPQLLTQGHVANNPYDIPEPLRSKVWETKMQFKETCGKLTCDGIKVG